MVNLVQGERNKEFKYRAKKSWFCVQGLTDWIYCISDQTEPLQGYWLSTFQFADMAPQARAVPSWAYQVISICFPLLIILLTIKEVQSKISVLVRFSVTTASFGLSVVSVRNNVRLLFLELVTSLSLQSERDYLLAGQWLPRCIKTFERTQCVKETITISNKQHPWFESSPEPESPMIQIETSKSRNDPKEVDISLNQLASLCI